jgi:hypothetical protein
MGKAGMTNINPKFHRVERVSKTVEIAVVKPKTFGKAEPNRRIRVSRKFSGAFIMDIEGLESITILPGQAFRLAAGIFKGLGIEMEYEWDGRK